MFTGIVECVGNIKKVVSQKDCLHLTIAPKLVFDDLKSGDSVAINGVCLTVTAFSLDDFDVTVVPQTQLVTNLSELKQGDDVNLERAIKLHSRIGGHCVQGHVDAVGCIVSLKPEGAAWLAVISLPAEIEKYVIKKGYITIDGMSITVIEVMKGFFSVTFIPHTQAMTVVNRYVEGCRVNIEVDMLAKYVERIFGGRVRNEVCN